ncbi:hypothetical protein [Blastococcus litoris]|uniref:hypothetical protein n=1 Tax=Blastococcus litoris TaxID=2171622 RepID=UPI000E3032A2|nr:hypothetical protein [Blastococcus litoris]
MPQQSALVRASALQLTAGLAGQVVALRRRHPYDTPVMRGRPEHVARDSWFLGTALSAPVVMLAPQAWATARLAGGTAEPARRVLRGLGSVMIAGYLMERLCRRRLTPGGFEPVETPIVVAGLGGAIAMALAARPQPRP